MERWPSHRFHAAATRLLDVLLAVLLLVALSPLLAGAALAIRLSDGGPALFRQRRVGKRRRLFTVLKFRTMRIEAVHEAGDQPAHRTQRHDPRVTWLGRVLRPSHLDELPQLLNVLAGEMSLVGVRPDTPMQRNDYPHEYWHDRHRFVPGITGPAQVARGDLTLEERSALEREWLDRKCLSLYLSLLCQTIGKVFARSSN